LDARESENFDIRLAIVTFLKIDLFKTGLIPANTNNASSKLQISR
jgi:hypothetical protein